MMNEATWFFYVIAGLWVASQLTNYDLFGDQMGSICVSE